jgi:hypothetical protein
MLTLTPYYLGECVVSAQQLNCRLYFKGRFFAPTNAGGTGVTILGFLCRRE